MVSFLSSLKIAFPLWAKISTGFVSLFSLSVLGLLLNFLDGQIKQLLQSKQQIEKIAAEINFFQQQQLQLIKFEEDKKKFSGTFNSFKQANFSKAIRPEDIQYLLQKWQNFYRIETLHLKLDSRVVFQQNLNLKKVPVVISVKTLKDYQFYGLLNKIQNELPGKVSLKSFSLKRVSSLTPDMVKDIAQGKRRVTLFEGKIEFDWFYCEDEKAVINKAIA